MYVRQVLCDKFTNWKDTNEQLSTGYKNSI